MSQSPSDFEQLDSDHDYLRGFEDLGKMIGQGKSFSGRERNCLYLNTGGIRSGTKWFADISSVSGFDLMDDGRGIAVTDWDGDGDLDFWLNNRTGPRVRFLNNRYAEDNRFLQVQLEGASCNRDAIGARVELHLEGDRSQTRTLIKTVRAGGNFLSQSSKTIHFGFRSVERIDKLVVHWPGGSSPEVIENVSLNNRLRIVENRDLNLDSSMVSQSKVTVTSRRDKSISFDPEPETDEKSDDRLRLFLTRRPKLPEVEYFDFAGSGGNSGPKSISKLAPQTRLITLWASWCAPCLEELAEFSEQSAEFSKMNVDILALSVDQLDEGMHTEDRDLIAKLKWPFQSGRASKSFVKALTELHHQVVYHERPLPLPTSFLIDSRGRVAVIYKGRVSSDQVSKDAGLLDYSGEKLAAVAFPFPGKSAASLFLTNELAIVESHVEAGDVDDARSELMNLITRTQSRPTSSQQQQLQQQQLLARFFLRLGQLEQSEKKFEAAGRAFQEVIKIAPRHPLGRVFMATVLWEQNEKQQSDELLRQVAEMRPDDANVLGLIASTYEHFGETAKAIAFYRRAIEIDPENTSHQMALAVGLQLIGESRAAIFHYEALLQETPNSTDVANNLAWLLATHRDDAIRDPARALTLAKSAYLGKFEQSPNSLDTLAAAFAASGDFASAIQTAETAIKMATTQGHEDLVKQIRSRVSQYKNSQPYRE